MGGFVSIGCHGPRGVAVRNGGERDMSENAFAGVTGFCDLHDQHGSLSTHGSSLYFIHDDGSPCEGRTIRPDRVRLEPPLPMKLWLLQRTGRTRDDEYDGFVVRATSQERARAILMEEHDGMSWDNKRAVCVELTAEGPEEEILGSFNAG